MTEVQAEFERIRQYGREKPALRRANTMPSRAEYEKRTDEPSTSTFTPYRRMTKFTSTLNGISEGETTSTATEQEIERLLQLAQPKEPKTEWYTSVGPHLRWGTQEMIWPVKEETLVATPTERVSALALPKVNHLKGNKVNRSQFYYSCGRTSVIWKVSKEAKTARSTERLNVLAEPKQEHKNYKEHRSQFTFSCGRESPIWQVDRNALSCGDRPLTNQLARHKTPHPDFVPEKPIRTVITPSALKAEATERLLSLSTPKNRTPGPFREPQWEITPSARNATASTRCQELARPKGVVDGYLLPRDEVWPVSRAAKRAVVSGRVDELSRPIVRASMDHVQFNPDAFLVKPLALKGSFPPRVEQLSKPIER